MSKLDDIVDSLPDTAAGQSFRFKYPPAKKQAIKELFLELIGEGEDRGDPSYYGLKPTAITYRREYRDELKAELRKKVEEL